MHCTGVTNVNNLYIQHTGFHFNIFINRIKHNSFLACIFYAITMNAECSNGVCVCTLTQATKQCKIRQLLISIVYMLLSYSDIFLELT